MWVPTYGPMASRLRLQHRGDLWRTPLWAGQRHQQSVHRGEGSQGIALLTFQGGHAWQELPKEKYCDSEKDQKGAAELCMYAYIYIYIYTCVCV